MRQQPKLLIKLRPAGAESEGCTPQAGGSTRLGFEGSTGLDSAADQTAGEGGYLGV